MQTLIEFYFNTLNYIDFNEICSCIINKKFFLQFYPTNYYFININKPLLPFLGKPLVFNEYLLNILEAHKQFRASVLDEKTTYLLQYKDINTELYRYTFQREKFLGIIKNILKGTENFYPDESIHEFETNIELINILISNLLESSNNISKFL